MTNPPTMCNLERRIPGQHVGLSVSEMCVGWGRKCLDILVQLSTSNVALS